MDITFTGNYSDFQALLTYREFYMDRRQATVSDITWYILDTGLICVRVQEKPIETPAQIWFI